MSQEVLVMIRIDNFLRIYNLKRQSESKKKKAFSKFIAFWMIM